MKNFSSLRQKWQITCMGGNDHCCIQMIIVTFLNAVATIDVLTGKNDEANLQILSLVYP